MDIATNDVHGRSSGDRADQYKYSENARPEVQALLPGAFDSLLDVGCAFGDFGAAVKRQQPTAEIWGIDPASAVVDVAPSRLDRFISGSFPGDLPESKFDCITFNDALEHFADPWVTLRETRQYLNDDGCLVVTLPNVRHYTVVRPLLLNGRWEYSDSGILDRTHLRFFTRSSAEKMFQSCGYSVDRVVPVNLTTRGRAARWLALLGPLVTDFRAVQYVFVVRPAV